MDNFLYVAAARDFARAHGDIELDDEPEVSHSEDGAYVQAWIWVDRRDLPQHVHESDPEDADYCGKCNAPMETVEGK